MLMATFVRAFAALCQVDELHLLQNFRKVGAAVGSCDACGGNAASSGVGVVVASGGNGRKVGVGAHDTCEQMFVYAFR